MRPGSPARILDSKLSCVPVGTVGVVYENLPLMKGMFVEVDTIHTALFGGGTVKGHGKYFFEYHEVEPYINGEKPKLKTVHHKVHSLVNEK